LLDFGVKMICEQGRQTALQKLISNLVEQSEVVLQNVRTIKAAYSHTKKPMPTAPSWFITGILEPLLKFRRASQDPKSALNMAPETVQEIIFTVVQQVTQRFRDLIREVIVQARKAEESLEKLRRRRDETKGGVPTNSVSTPVSAGDATRHIPAVGGPRITTETASDRDKMIVQLYLDAHEYGNYLRNFGIHKESYAPLESVFRLCRRADWILGAPVPEPPEIDEE
jgi:hypothetical protein